MSSSAERGSNDGVCDHCEGTGRVWEPCHVGNAHEYHCACPQEIDCLNCDGTGHVALEQPRDHSTDKEGPDA